MPSSTSVNYGNLNPDCVLSIALTPAIVGANTTAEQTFAVNGLIVGDWVAVQKPTPQAGLGIVGARVSAANTLAITWVNATAGGLTPTAGERYLIRVSRYENYNVSNAPAALV